MRFISFSAELDSFSINVAPVLADPVSPAALVAVVPAADDPAPAVFPAVDGPAPADFELDPAPDLVFFADFFFPVIEADSNGQLRGMQVGYGKKGE